MEVRLLPLSLFQNISNRFEQVSRVMVDYRRLQTDLAALALFAGILFLALSLLSFTPTDAPSTLLYPVPQTVSNWCGPAGAFAAHTLMKGFGYSCYLLIACIIIFDLSLFSERPLKDLLLRALGVTLIIFSLSTGMTLFLPGIGTPGIYGSGGFLGAVGGMMLESHFSIIGSLLILLTLLLSGLMLAAENFALALLKAAVLLPVFALHKKLRPVDSGNSNEEAPTEESPEEEPQNQSLLDRLLLKKSSASTEPDSESIPLSVPEETEEEEPPQATLPFKVNPPVVSKTDPEEDEFETDLVLKEGTGSDSV